MRQVSRALAILFQPVKVDTMVMGHLCPHVHCHVYPQCRHDDPPALVNVQEGGMRLSEVEQAARVGRLRGTLDEFRRSSNW